MELSFLALSAAAALLGVATAAFVSLIPGLHIYNVIAFTMLVLVLVFRPSGILGERIARARA